MASTGEFIINLNDDRHPNLELSKLNNESPFFKVLPSEVHLMIYEFAVYVDELIMPCQVEPYSNKFVDKNPRSILKEFATVPLARTCRAIYAELERWNPFYKVNAFNFETQQNCLAYLVAITPQRRKQIRWINLEIEGYRIIVTREALREWDVEPGLRAYLSDGMILDKNLLTMLSHCDSLHSHKLCVRLDFRDYNTGEPEGILGDFVWRIRDTVRLRGQCLLWDLPFFGYELLLDPGEIDHWSLVELGNDIDNAIRVNRESIGHDGPQGFKEMAKNNWLNQAAITASRIQFPGELRISWNKESSSIGSVASRTRAKCRDPNSIGIVERTIPRYNQEGYLIEIEDITDIRWDKTSVQCEVVDSRGRKEWENLYVVLVPSREYPIRFFYYGLIWKFQSGKVSLEKLQAVPPPQHVLDIAETIWAPEHFLYKDEKKWTWKAWRRLIGEWNSIVK